MWSPTTDQKNKEDSEDCACGSVSDTITVQSSSATTAAAAATLQQKNNFNILDNKAASRSNSNSSSSSSILSENISNISQTKIFGGHKINEEEQKHLQLKKKDFEAEIETEDSGFISGKITEDLDDDKKTNEVKFTGGVGGGGGTTTTKTLPEEKKTNIKEVHKQLMNIAVDDELFDSGCIDVEIEEPIHKEIQQQQQLNNRAQEQKSEAALKRAASSLSSQFSADSVIATAPANVATTATTHAVDSSSMLHKDSGMEERFGNLTLQNTSSAAAPQHHQQHQLQRQSASVVGIKLNNLDSDRRRSATIDISETILPKNNKNILSRQQQVAGNIAYEAPAERSYTTPSNAWEQYYQQNDDGDTYLHQACIFGYEDVVTALIRMAPHPCLFNIPNDEAQTPLHLATLAVQPRIIRMLLIAGAEPTLRDRHGNTALHLACMSGEEQCVRALTIEISASEINEAHRLYGHRSNDKAFSYLSFASLPSDLEIRNYDGERCVHLAAQAGHTNILRILVGYGADINAREGKSGRTPLHIAIENCNEDLVNFLLDEFLVKINLETATYAGLTAYQVACILNKSQMQNMLEKHGAELLTPPESDDDSDMDSDLEDSKMYDRFGDPGYFKNYNGCNPMTVA